MAQTKLGAMKCAAQYAGLSFDEYKLRVDAGLKKCTKCKLWFPRTEFCIDRSRGDGLSCLGNCCKRVKVKKCTKGRPSAFKGKRHDEATRKRISIAVREAMKGKTPYWKGKHLSEETKKKIAAVTLERTARGERHYAWSHGKAARALESRRDYRYRYWREDVFKRDHYTCQKCGDSKGGNLRAHHIKSFAEHPELRFDVSNGITLCHRCHELEHFKPESIRNTRRLKRGEPLWI